MDHKKNPAVSFLQIITEYTGYDSTKDPTDWQASGNAMRVFALRWHDKYDHIFVTGGWDRQLKVSQMDNQYLLAHLIQRLKVSQMYNQYLLAHLGQRLIGELIVY